MDFFPTRRRGDLSKRFRGDDVLSAFDDFFNSRWGDLPAASALNNFSPEVNVRETDKEYIVEAELAGLKRDEIDIELKGDQLILKGEKKSFDEDRKEDYYHMERRYGSFYRSIPFDTEVDESKCDASYKDGLLTIKLPKKGEKNKSRKINIQ